MSTAQLRRHHRRALDHVLHHAHRGWAEPQARAAFVELVAAARARSDLFEAAPRLHGGRPIFEAARALIHLARWWPQHRAPIASWPGAYGHPRVILDDLQRHVLGLYPAPRFLAQVWEAPERADADDWRNWVIAYGRGTAWRHLPLPIALTRAMERAFLATEEHVPIASALRRAEVLGLGGSPELAAAVAATWLGQTFEHGEYWREALAWLSRQGDALPLEQLGQILEYLEAARAGSATPPLRGRTAASLWRRVSEWHQAIRWGVGSPSWPAAEWGGRDERLPLSDGRTLCWHLIQLRDPGALVAEGHAMRHCVASYRVECKGGISTIWSLRSRVERPDELGRARSVLTLEVRPRTRTIVQMKGFANREPSGPGVAVVQRWVKEQGLRISPTLARKLAW